MPAGQARNLYTPTVPGFPQASVHRFRVPGWAAPRNDGITLPYHYGSAETPGEDSLLRVQPVLRFVPDDRLGTIDDPGRHLFTALCRQAMHEDGIGFGMRHQMLVDPIRRQEVVTVDTRLNAHRNPRVGDDAICSGDRLHRICREGDTATLALSPIEEPLWWYELPGAGEPQG